MSSSQSPPTSFKTLLIILGYLLIVVIAWGSNYPLIKLALRDLEPLTFSVLRLVGGTIVVLVLLKLTNTTQLLPIKRERFALVLISVLQIVSVLGLASVALLYLPAGRTVALIYSMPFWAALFDIVLFKSRPTSLQAVGILFSLIGLLVYFDPSVLAWHEEGVPFGLFITIFAAFMWGLGAVLYRRYDFKTPLLSQTLWQLGVASIIMLILAAWLEFPSRYEVTPRIIFILVWNWFVPTALAVWSWTKLLNFLPGVIAGQLLMLTPFVGIGFSALVFGETLPPVFALSVVLISVGGVLSLVRRR